MAIVANTPKKKFRLLTQYKRDRKVLEDGTVLYRIQAVRTFGNPHVGTVFEGQLGGWVDREQSLSHEGSCWIGHEAVVALGSTVQENSAVINNAMVINGSHICEDSFVRNDAYISRSSLCERSRVGNTSRIERSELFRAKVFGIAEVLDSALHGAIVDEKAQVRNVFLNEAACVVEAAILDGIGYSGRLHIPAWAQIGADAYVTSENDVMTISPIGSENGTLTIYRTKDPQIIRFNRGCFNGTLQEFTTAVNRRHRQNRYAREYRAAIEFAKLKFDIKAVASKASAKGKQK